MERRLAAILVADIVGYSRLMGEDEAATLAHLKSCEADVIEPSVQRHHGRIVKRMGDGYLVAFASVVAAVECAIEWQAGVQEPGWSFFSPLSICTNRRGRGRSR
jgi:class 3 adenylate cyclase